MNSYKGFEIVPVSGMISSGTRQIRMTVSAKKVGLSEQLIDALGHPACVSFHRGVGENEGKLLVTAAEYTGKPGEVRIDQDRKNAEFFNYDFVSICDEMIRTYAGGSFKKGTYFNIVGMRVDDTAYIFDFRNAVEHTIKNGMRGTSSITQMPHPGAFPMAPRGYNMPERSVRSQG